MLSALWRRILAPYVPLLASRSASVPALKLYTLYTLKYLKRRFAIFGKFPCALTHEKDYRIATIARYHQITITALPA